MVVLFFQQTNPWSNQKAASVFVLTEELTMEHNANYS
jgi:hypothetical protein